MVLRELQRARARGRAAGARHRRRPAAGLRGVLRRRGRPHLRRTAAPCTPGRADRGDPRDRRAQPSTSRRAGPSCPAPDRGLAAGRVRARSDDHGRLAGSSAGSRASCWDPAVRAADMDADGVGQQVVSPTPVFFGYEHQPADAAKIAADLQRPGPGDLRRGARPADPVLPGPAAGSGRRLRRARPLPGRRARRRGDRQPRRRPGPRRRRHRHVPAALRRGRGAGVRAPVGHAQLAPAAAGGWRSG